MFGTIGILAKDNVTIVIGWRFGPNWPGERCGAKTRRGTTCQRPSNKRNGRCRLHGGVSKGPRTKEGLAKIPATNMTNCQHTKAMIAKREEKAKIAKGLPDRLRVIEQNLRPHGVID